MDDITAKWLKVYLKCYINLIFYHRNVYPAASFDLASYQGFNLPQFMPVNRHPVVKSYIEEFIDNFVARIQKMYRMNVCIVTTREERYIERYVLDFRNLLSRPDNSPKVYETQVYDGFRTSLNNLIRNLETLPRIHDGAVTFEFVGNALGLELGHSSDNLKTLDNPSQRKFYEQDMNWVKSDSETPFSNSAEQIHMSSAVKMVPLVGVSVGSINLTSFTERLKINDRSLNYVYELDDSMVMVDATLNTSMSLYSTFYSDDELDIQPKGSRKRNLPSSPGV